MSAFLQPRLYLLSQKTAQFNYDVEVLVEVEVEVLGTTNLPTHHLEILCIGIQGRTCAHKVSTCTYIISSSLYYILLDTT